MILLPVVLVLAAAPAASVPAAVLETHFMCGKHVVEQLVLTPGARTSIRVPEGCPDHGASWSVSIECKDRCRGELSDSSGKIAVVDGPAQKDGVLEVTAEPKAPATASQVVLRVADLVRADATANLQRPVQVSIRTATLGKSFAAEVPLTTIDTNAGHFLAFETQRVGLDKVHLVVWLQRAGQPKEKKRVFDRVMTLGGEDAPFDCGLTQGFCEGAARLSVREYHGPGEL